MTTYGIGPDGFIPETTDIIRTSVETDFRQTFFASLPLGDKTLLGHIIGVLAERLGKLWELLEQCFNMLDPDKASGAMLRALALLTGTLAKGASSSAVAETLVGDPGTLIAAGHIVSALSNGQKFLLVIDTTILTLDAWTTSTAYSAPTGPSVGSRVTANGNAYQCITSGTSSGGGSGPSTTDADITDGTVHWKYLGVGTGAVNGIYVADQPGEIFVAAGDLTTIETPVGGLNNAVNLNDCSVGASAQSDESLRLAREADLSRAGTGTPDALRQSLLDLSADGVTAVTVFTNYTSVTDINGLPPYRYEVLVQGGDEALIVSTIWKNAPLGIRSYSSTNTSAPVVDSQGVTQTIYYTRPTAEPIYIDISVEADPLRSPSDLAAQIQDAIVLFGDVQPAGANAVSRKIGAQAFVQVDETGVSPVNDVLHCYIGLAPSPVTETTIPISLRQLATYSTTNISVTISYAAP